MEECEASTNNRSSQEFHELPGASGTTYTASSSNPFQNKGILLNMIMELMDTLSSESEDEEEVILNQLLKVDPCSYVPHLMIRRHKRNSIKDYIEITVPSYTEFEFRSHFRISRSLCESLSKTLSESIYYKSLRCDKRLPESVYMLVFLWFAGHEACSFRDLSDRFNLALSTICVIIKRVSLFVSSLSPDLIKWSNDAHKAQSAEFFGNKCQFYKAIGCIDGTHIVIDPPNTSKDDYIDRKGNTTVCMQAICNENKKFINVFIGHPGSCHDSWVFKNSPIYDKLSSYCANYYLLGDSAYPCSKHLITPYRDNGHLTRAQKNFNVKLSSGRVCIEHSFGILKQRFRQLYYCKLRGMEKICHFIRACCVLHNIANEDDLEFSLDTIEVVAEDCNGESEPVHESNFVRDAICESFRKP